MKVLVLDIETSPATAYVWRTFKENIGNEQIIQPTRMICWAAKWVGEKAVTSRAEWEDRDIMVFDLWQMLDAADAVVTYNGKSFDVPHINREFIEAGMNPPSPFAQIDLYNTVRSKFKFMSGKLGYVVEDLELGGKMAHEGFALWRKVLEGDTSARKRMVKYNVQDVKITEALYTTLRPWISGHPNTALADGQHHACPVCGSGLLTRRGIARTNVSEFQRWQCTKCGSYSRSGKAERRTDLRSVAAS